MNASRAFTGNFYRSPPELAEWLDLGVEKPIETDIPIVDCHHHIWNSQLGQYELPQYRSDIAGNNIVGSIFIECGANYDGIIDYAADEKTPLATGALPVRETEYVCKSIENDAAADAQGLCKGIIGFVNLLLGASTVRRILEAHVQAGGGRFRGIRQRAAWDPVMAALASSHALPPKGLLRDERLRSGFSVLSQLGLTFDAWVYHPQLDDVVDLAAAFPDTIIVLDHCGSPLGVGQHRPDEVFKVWRRELEKMAALPNVVIKIGGLGMLSTGSQFHFAEKPPSSATLAKAWKPYIETAVELLGADRCMIESNFPVDRQTCGYTTLWNAYKIATRQYTNAERAGLFHGNANRVYALGIDVAKSGAVQTTL